MKTDFEKWLVCPHCGKPLNSWLRGNFKGAYFDQIRKERRFKHFCTEECCHQHQQNYVVEVYNGSPIYCLIVDNEERYLPYMEAPYYFPDIESCKQRMDAKVAFFHPNLR